MRYRHVPVTLDGSRFAAAALQTARALAARFGANIVRASTAPTLVVPLTADD